MKSLTCPGLTGMNTNNLSGKGSHVMTPRLSIAGFRLLAACCLALLLSACGAVLPGEGPSAARILEGPAKQDVKGVKGYAVVRLNGPVIAELLRFEPEGLRKTFSAGHPENFQNRIGVGDILQINIWEAAENGLFSTADNKRTQFPPIRVDRRGRITIPFVGTLRARGRTRLQLQKRIERALEGKAISPQVMVNVVKNVANSVVVNGDVRKPGRYQMGLKGDRILDVIAAAGGAAAPAREVMVTLIRDGKRGVQNLKRIIRDPSENIYVHSGDQIYLSHNPQTFTAFGAVSKKGEYPFDSDRVNILEAVARAGGLLDNRADSKGVFLFRIEDNRVLESINYPREELNPAGKTPTVYVLDMSQPRAFFLAQGFLMRDNDAIYVANSVGTELQKFLSLVNSGMAAARGTYSLATIGN